MTRSRSRASAAAADGLDLPFDDRSGRQVGSDLKPRMADTEKREPATFREIRDILRQVSESQQETDRRLQETDRLLKRQAADADRRGQETDRRMRELHEMFTGHWGKLMQALVDGDLIELLRGRDIDVDHTITNLKKINGQTRVEFDIVAVNGEEAVAVEVKTTLKVRDVDHFVEMLAQFAAQLPEYRGRKVYGAVAYLKADEKSDSYAEKRGLFVIRATGSSASITNREGFTPRVFAP